MKKWLLTLATGLMLCSHAYALSATSLDDAIRQAQSQTDGRVLSTQTQQQDGRLQYRIKVLTADGQVKIIYIDGPKTGN